MLRRKVLKGLLVPKRVHIVVYLCFRFEVAREPRLVLAMADNFLNCIDLML